MSSDKPDVVVTPQIKGFIACISILTAFYVLHFVVNSILLR